MNYVEWLRVRNLWRNLAIILGILVLLAVVLRVSVSRYMSPEAWIGHFESHPGVTSSQTTLPDGTKRTVIDDPSEQTHIVIDDHGYHGKHIVVTQPVKHSKENKTRVSVGSMHVYDTHNGTTETTVIDTNGSVPMIYYMTIADLVALFVAIVLAAPFAREVGGHLEVALMKPISRTRFAIGAIFADVVGIIGASIMTVVAFYLCQLLFESPRLDFTGINAQAIAMGLIFPLAWYAMLCAATTWASRSYIAVLVAALPVVLLIGGLTLVHPDNLVTLFVHDVAWVLSRFIPLSYISLMIPESSGMIDAPGAPNFVPRLALEIFFFVVYAAIAIWQWRRVEA
jgi:hypothetical protein